MPKYAIKAVSDRFYALINYNIQFSWCATFLHISSTFFDVQTDWFDIILSQIEK